MTVLMVFVKKLSNQYQLERLKARPIATPIIEAQEMHEKFEKSIKKKNIKNIC